MKNESTLVISRYLSNKNQTPVKMKLAANISWLFKEEPDLLKRLKLAKDNGFDYVELAWPFEYSIDEFVNAVNLAGVKQG